MNYLNMRGGLTNEDLCIIESAEIAVDRALLFLEAHNRMVEIKEREIELRCFIESADFETCQEYFEDAEKELDDKKEGLMKQVWRKIKEFFGKIRDFLFGKRRSSKDIDGNSTVYVQGWIAYICNNIKGAWSSAKSALANGKKKLSENGNWKKLLAVLGVAGAGVTVAAVFTNKKNKSEKVELPVSKIKETLETAEDITQTVYKYADTAEQGGSEADGVTAKQIKTVGNVVNNVVSTLNTALDGGHDSFDSKVNQNDEATKDKIEKSEEPMNERAKGLEKKADGYNKRLNVDGSKNEDDLKNNNHISPDVISSFEDAAKSVKKAKRQNHKKYDKPIKKASKAVKKEEKKMERWKDKKSKEKK